MFSRAHSPVFLWSLALAMTLVFAGITWAVLHGHTQDFDDSVALAMKDNSKHTSFWRPLMIALTLALKPLAETASIANVSARPPFVISNWADTDDPGSADGGFSGEGISPDSSTSRLPRWIRGSGIGIADNNAFV